MSATNHSNDYFRIVDLNPPAPAAPIVDPRDPRAMCYFGFVAQGQRISMEFGTNPPPNGLRILYTFDYEYNGGVGTVPPVAAKPHGMLAIGGGPADQDQMYIELHDRAFVALWIDPTGTQPAVGQTVQASVRAWRQD
jgi:hypothetical protein